MKKTLTLTYDAWIIEKIKSDPALACQYLDAVMQQAQDASGKTALLTAIKQVAETQGISRVAKAAGLPRESLTRALSEDGNPHIDTLLAILGALGMKLSVTYQPPPNPLEKMR